MHQVLCFISCLLICLSAHTKPLIILDAGSTGTRLYIYDVENGQVQSLMSVKVKPELSKLDPNDPSAYDQYFDQLMKTTTSVLDEATRAQTPIYLYATAGLRMKPIEEQQAILKATRASLSKQAQTLGYIEPADENIRTISGGEEALFVWLADNYAKGNLENDYLFTHNTTAALEMGGASAEIAYLSVQATDHVLPFHHREKSYPIYGIGYDGLGADQAMAKVFQAHQTQPNDFPACFPVNASYPLNSDQVTGEGNFDRCVSAIRAQLIDDDKVQACQAVHQKHCSGFGEYQPREVFTNRYILTSGFYHVFNVFGLANQNITSDTFVNAGRDYCRMTWDEVKTQYTGVNESYLINYCFTASLSKVLFDAWQVNKRDKLTAVSSLNDITLEWPVGAALQLAP